MSTPFFPRATRRGAAMDWVKFDAELARDGSVDPVDKALYAAIGSFVDAETRESPETTDLDPNNIPPWVPTRKRLAECIGKSLDTLDRATKRLEARGLLRVHRQPDPTNPRRILPSEYELLDHHIWDERAAQRAAERAARKAGGRETHGSGGGRTDAATPGRTHAATPGRTGAAVKDIRESLEEGSGEAAPSARSAGGVRSTSTSGRSARDGRSGSAASGKAGSSSGKGGEAGVPGQRGADGTRLTWEQTAAVHTVEALLPQLLVAKLPYGHIPQRNRAAVLEALESRTVDQLRERIARRWVAYGYEPVLHDGELRSAVGVALELIAPTPYCPDPSCEDGVMVDTGEDCRACSERRKARRAARLTGKTPPTGKSGSPKAPAPECVDCGRPLPRAAPADSVCQRCTDEAAAAFAALAADLSGQSLTKEGDDTTTERDALELEAQRLRARRATGTAPAIEDTDVEQAAADAAQDARLRAELLAANPWMACYTQTPVTAS